MVRTSTAAILRYHFNDDNIHFALSVSMLGFATGLTVIPIVAEYAFTKYGFSTTMLLIAPFLSLHLSSGLTYAQTPMENSKALLDHQNTTEKSEWKEDTSKNSVNTNKDVLHKVLLVVRSPKVCPQR